MTHSQDPERVFAALCGAVLCKRSNVAAEITCRKCRRLLGLPLPKIERPEPLSDNDKATAAAIAARLGLDLEIARAVKGRGWCFVAREPESGRWVRVYLRAYGPEYRRAMADLAPLFAEDATSFYPCLPRAVFDVSRHRSRGEACR